MESYVLARRLRTGQLHRGDARQGQRRWRLEMEIRRHVSGFALRHPEAPSAHPALSPHGSTTSALGKRFNLEIAEQTEYSLRCLEFCRLPRLRAVVESIERRVG